MQAMFGLANYEQAEGPGKSLPGNSKSQERKRKKEKQHEEKSREIRNSDNHIDEEPSNL